MVREIGKGLGIEVTVKIASVKVKNKTKNKIGKLKFGDVGGSVQIAMADDLKQILESSIKAGGKEGKAAVALGELREQVERRFKKKKKKKKKKKQKEAAKAIQCIDQLVEQVGDKGGRRPKLSKTAFKELANLLGDHKTLGPLVAALKVLLGFLWS